MKWNRPDAARALVASLRDRSLVFLLPASLLGIALISFLLVPTAHSQTPPAGCISNVGGPCVTLCGDGTWSSTTGSNACANHGGVASVSPSASPPPTTAPTPAPTPAPALQPNPALIPAPVPSPASGGTIVPLPPSSVAAAVPTPSPATFATGSTAPPQNIFYVSPEGCDPGPPPATNCGTFPAASLLCTSTTPCRTIDFALTQARDGDAIDLAGGTYNIPSEIEIDKLVTIQPNANVVTQQSSTQTITCTAVAVPLYSCVFTVPANILSGSTVTITASTGASIASVQITAVGVTPCVVGPIPASTLTVTLTCGPGQTLPSGSQVIINVLQPTTVLTVPTVTVTVNAPTLSNRPVLESTYGGPIFHVTAVGSPGMHATIFGLTIGNATSVNQSAAIVLDNDSYTEISHDVIGAQDLPNAIGILLDASDHPLIHDNTIQGSTLFPRTASIEEGQSNGGFGVVTDECFGSINHSNGVQLINNLLARNSNAGIWFCSDGTGGFLVSGNAIRANGRGIVLFDAVDTVISTNTIGDNVLDGIDMFESSERNIITSNTVESQQGTTSIGILLAGKNGYIPLGNQIASNQIRRNTVDVAIVGAQGTQLQNNSITAVGTNTGVLFTLALPGFSSGPPLNTTFSGNALESSGSCTATNGCAIRLTAGITVPIDASVGNAFGTGDPASIQAQIWDHGRDPALGTVYVLTQAPPVTASGILGLTPTPAPGVPPLGFTPAVSGPPQVVSRLALPTGSTAGAPVPITSAPTLVAPSTGTAASTPAGAGGAAAGTATAYIDPSSGSYYAPLLFCIQSTDGTPVTNEALTINFLDSTGGSLGTTTVMSDASGCFNGNVAPQGGSPVQPVQVTVADAGGTKETFAIQVGAAPTRPPVGPIQ